MILMCECKSMSLLSNSNTKTAMQPLSCKKQAAAVGTFVFMNLFLKQELMYMHLIIMVRRKV